ncbi:GNAT family N-acetyltransferase [Chryseobacterium sp. MFBS3-17]|uniref:GNAT family N-acetyltransferase n=1 Tax=Chryseobacterium sp. MFBS3-17 TaxID=2886689 RepID=UPI001D0E0413|nr:GNAT family N-acetyltransferase [Chryseobacterium sp. MFBS3-17]MCC2591216.1 GNAT family N-acetyltransferase [Chryseobacterium sp. MFBS3-17]
MNKPVWHIQTFHELSTSELYKILQVRADVFVVEQNCPYQDLDGSDEHAVHIRAEINGNIAAYCRIFAPGIKYDEASIGRVLTGTDYRRLKLGKSLMHIAISAIETRYGTSQIRISAQDYLIRFYEEFGFENTGKQYLEDHLPHTEMLRL